MDRPAALEAVAWLHDAARAGAVAQTLRRFARAHHDPLERIEDILAYCGKTFPSRKSSTLNPVDSALLARAVNRAKTHANYATSDVDITWWQRLLLDLDPKRPAGIASTDAEHQAALDRARAIRERLRALGWPEPLLIDGSAPR